MNCISRIVFIVILLFSLQIKAQHKKINKTFDDWKGDIEQIDDVCIVGLKF